MPPHSPERIARFWTLVNKNTDTGCWLWTGWRSRGYGRWRPNGDPHEPPVKAHRYAYELTHGPIPPGLDLAMTCGTRACVNPEHHQFMNAVERAAKIHPHCKAVSTHCKRNHEWTEANTYIDPKGRPYCRTCVREQNRAAYERKRHPITAP